MIKNLKKVCSKSDSHKEQGTFLTAIKSKQHSANAMQALSIRELCNADNCLEQVNGGGASHVAASSDPYAMPYGLHLH